MLVVIAIIVLLVALMLPALQNVESKWQQIQCLNNMRQLTHAWVLYAADSDGVMVDPFNVPNSCYCGWCATASVWAGPYNTLDAITTGALYKYLNTINVYRCPAETKSYVRSYSMNERLNGPNFYCDNLNMKRLGSIPRPAVTMCFIEENDERGWNMNSFVLTGNLAANQWTDHPACWHRKGTNLAFSDGHVEYWVWDDPRTCTIPNIGYTMPPPHCPDLDRLAAVVKTW